MYLTVKQVSERICLSPKTVYRYMADGRLPFHRLSEHCIRIDEKDLIAYMDSIKEQS